MARSKNSLNVIKDLVSFLEWLDKAGVRDKILTPYGDGLLEGLVTSDPKFTPEFVSLDKYNELQRLLVDKQKLIEELRNKLNNKKGWF